MMATRRRGTGAKRVAKPRAPVKPFGQGLSLAQARAMQKKLAPMRERSAREGEAKLAKARGGPLKPGR